LQGSLIIAEKRGSNVMKILGVPGPGLIAGALTVVFGFQAAGAATCMDELDRFERRLQNSSLAAADPDAFQALVRQAEEAAELRDEEQCLLSVAELNAELPEDADPQPVSRQTSSTGETRDNASRPAPPVLLIAGGAGTDTASAEGKTDEAEEDGESRDDRTDDDDRTRD
jgi:hypothetical protein